MNFEKAATDSEANPRLASSLRAFSKISSLLVVAVGASVLAGWALDSAVLVALAPKLVAMNPVTALAFVLAGASLWLRGGPAARLAEKRWPLRFAQGLAVGTALLGLFRLSELFLGWPAGIDQLFFPEKLAAAPGGWPNRMAPNTAFNFLLVGSALLLLDVETRRGRRPAQFLALGTALVAFLALVGYGYGAPPFYRLPLFIPMALNTAVAFLVLSLGVLCAHPDRGMMIPIGRDSAGGRLARWLLPAAVAVPVLLGWVRWQGQEAGLYGTSVGITLYTTSTVVILVLLVWRSAFHLDRADLERRRTAEEINRLNQDLERRVEERTAELQVSESKFRGLLEMAPDAILTVNRDGRIVLANAQAEKLFGYRREELLGHSIELLVPERFQEKHRRQCEAYFADPQARTMQAGTELCARRQDGSEFPAEMTLSALETEQGVLVTSIIRDLTERKRTEQEINRLFTLALDLLCVAGFDGYFKRLNPTWEKTLGFTTAELLQKPYLDFVHPEDQAATRAEAEKLAQGAPVISFQNRYVCREGSYRWLQWTAYPIPEEKLIYAAARDVTAQKEAEQRIRQINAELAARTAELSVANEELAGANEELEGFTYSVSHDLRAPLRHIDGFSRLLLEEHSRELSGEARHYLERVRQGTQHMGSLVDDLLNLARVGRQEPRRQVTGLGSLVEEVRRELQGELEGRKVEWRVGALPFVECDPGLMKQVFANLLSNAVKFSRPRQPAVIEVGAQTANGAPAVFVRDNGVGFSMKYADKLFGVFQRLHRSEDFEGTGVGLATVQRIVHKHGGRVWAEAELDKGATFYFTLESGPAEQALQAAPSTQARARPKAAVRETQPPRAARGEK